MNEWTNKWIHLAKKVEENADKSELLEGKGLYLDLFLLKFCYTLVVSLKKVEANFKM